MGALRDGQTMTSVRQDQKSGDAQFSELTQPPIMIQPETTPTVVTTAARGPLPLDADRASYASSSNTHGMRTQEKVGEETHAS